MISTVRESRSLKGQAADPRRDLLDRILASALFARSERLSTLLVYLCELALEGRLDEISEQSIGQKVFGRPESYDSANDGIVRTQTSRLRQKLELYFDGDGAGEAIRILIPRGGYVPYFVPKDPDRISGSALRPGAVGEPDLIIPLTESAQRRETTPLAWILVGVLLAVVLGLMVRTGISLHQQREQHPFWSHIFAPGSETLLVPADSTLVYWQGLRGQNMGLADYLDGAFREEETSGDPEKHGRSFAQGRYTSIVDLEIASRLSQMAPAGRSGAQIRYARDVRPNDLKQGNIVLIGSDEANPWVYLFEKDMNFYFFNDRQQEVFYVKNRLPQKGEPQAWGSSYEKDKEHRVDCVVAYRPNLSGDGNVLILEGTSMAGTECAWDFVSDDSQLLPFLKQIRSGDGRLPPFEVVLGTKNMSGSAVKSSILAWRVGN